MAHPTDYIKRRVEEFKKQVLNAKPGWCGCEGYAGCVGCRMDGIHKELDKLLPLIEELLQEESDKVKEWANERINNDPYGFTTLEGRSGYIKALKDCLDFIFPQKDTPTTKEPTLEELIEACGEEFACVRNFKEELIRAHGKIQGLEYWNSGSYGTEEWVADSTRSWTSNEGTSGWVSAKGSTPKEAVKNLLAALSYKK